MATFLLAFYVIMSGTMGLLALIIARRESPVYAEELEDQIFKLYEVLWRIEQQKADVELRALMRRHRGR